MITDDIDETKHLPMTEMPDENEDESSKMDQKSQEFAHTKDKKIENARNALDAMDIDTKLDEQKKFNETEDTPEEREGKSLDMSKLQDTITIDTHKVERDTETIFGKSNQSLTETGSSTDVVMVSINPISQNLHISK